MATMSWSCLLKIFYTFTCYLYFVQAKSQLVILNEDNWDSMLTGEWMVEFYAPWCPACKNLQPQWEGFSSWSKDLGISVGQVDVTASPGLSGRFMVTALPTIFQ
uniref:Thioredoxin domain-containing protein n=1 Tax=Clastoptera arizonana TaxID=38151 RepID=A0A1B6CUB4_9HEMI